jgi:hypothetical protein
MLFSQSEGVITVVKLAAADKPSSLELFGGGQAMALHPGGEHLVVEAEGLLAIVHLPTLSLIKTVWILDKPGPVRTLMEQRGVQIAEQFEKKLAAHISPDQLAEHKARSARHFLPKQPVRCMTFSPSGRNLICGTNAGVCILNWEQMLTKADMTSVEPVVFAEAERMPREDGMPGNQLIYAVPLDGKKERVLFSGLEGKIRFVNLREGRAGDLIAPPFRWPLWRLELTPDRSALVATAVNLHDKGRKESPKFQIWSYPALCQAAGIEY